MIKVVLSATLPDERLVQQVQLEEFRFLLLHSAMVQKVDHVVHLILGQIPWRTEVERQVGELDHHPSLGGTPWSINN